jgi:hypothetical protein
VVLAMVSRVATIAVNTAIAHSSMAINVKPQFTNIGPTSVAGEAE